MKILVTGGCGYKGSVLVPKLLARGYRVNVADIMWFGDSLAPHENLNVLKADIRNIENIDLDEIDTIFTWLLWLTTPAEI